MGKLATLLRPAFGIGLLISSVLATPASALELAMGGTFYVSVLEGDCPQPIDLWGVGPGRNPLFLGHYQGHVNKRPPIFMGAYKPGQEMYIWHETNDPGTGERRSQDIKSPDAYKVSIDPRGGYLIELKGDKGQPEAGLKMWVYPSKAPIPITPTASVEKAGVSAQLGSMVVNQQAAPTELAGQPMAASAVGTNQPAPAGTGPKQADTVAGWQWPMLQASIAMLLFVSYRRSRQVALAAGDLAPALGVDVQPYGQSDDTLAFQALGAGLAAHAADDASMMFSAGSQGGTAPMTVAAPQMAPPPMLPPAPVMEVSAHDEDTLIVKHLEAIAADTVHLTDAAVVDHVEPQIEAKVQAASAPAATHAAAAPASPASAAPVTPARAHYTARPPEGWAPLPSDGNADQTAGTPATQERGAMPVHQPSHTHTSVRATARPAPISKPAATEAEGLLEALGRRRPMGLPLAFAAPRAAGRAPVHAPNASSSAVVSVTRALSGAFHDLELIHADEELVVLSGLDLALRRRVSIHALAPALSRDEKLSAQFVRDALEFAQLSHKGLLRVHRVSFEPIPHCVAEPLPGQPLSALLASGEPMALHEVLGAGAHLTEALDYLHQRGMVHGDLRPSRVAGGTHHDLRLCPGVFAQLPLEHLTARGLTAMERRAYRPPEMASGGAADYRGDLYSLGLLLHHMITGALPAHVSADDDSGATFKYRPAVPANLTTLVRRCLQADPGRRYQDSGIARQMLETMFRDHAVRDRVVLTCLPGLARVVRTTLQPMGALMSTVHEMPAEQMAREVVTPAWRDTVRTKLTGPDGGLSAIGVLLEKSHGLRRWQQEAPLVAVMERLGRMAIELAGLATLIESGGPRHPAVASNARTELIRLSDEIASFEHTVQEAITARLVDLAGVVKDAFATATMPGLSVEAQGVAPGLRGLFAEPGQVRLQLVAAISTGLAAARASGATAVTVHGTYEDSFKRMVLTLTDDGRGVPAPVVRPPLAIVPRLTRPAIPAERATVRELEQTFEAVERLGGRVMVSNRSGEAGVELRIELPSNLC